MHDKEKILTRTQGTEIDRIIRRLRGALAALGREEVSLATREVPMPLAAIEVA